MGMLDECILWTGTRTTNGYGRARCNGEPLGAHVLAWVVANGPVPPGMYVCHRCDVRLCVNVSHLWLGTPGDNMRDAAAKGRLPTGTTWHEVNGPRPTGREHPRPLAKLTEADVRSIRGEAASSTHQALAQQYGVSRSAISDIIRRRRWAWVE